MMYTQEDRVVSMLEPDASVAPHRHARFSTCFRRSIGDNIFIRNIEHRTRGSFCTSFEDGPKTLIVPIQRMTVYWQFSPQAGVVKLADARDSKSRGVHAP